MRKNEKRSGFLTRLFRKDYNFYAGLAAHAAKVSEGLCVLALWAKTGDPALAQRIRDIEHEADQIQLRIEDELGDVFSTPIDRDDIHHLANIVDQIMNYAKNTVREVEIFNLTMDDEMVLLTTLLEEGTCAIKSAVCCLESRSPEIVKDIETAVKTERVVEKMYRQGLKHLFELDDIKEILKRREVYRHLSNTADRIHDAASLLSMIHVKYE